MPKLIALFLLSLLFSAASLGENNQCLELFSAKPTAGSSRITSIPTLDAMNIRILNWNIQKSSSKGWNDELRELSTATDLILLQEATLESELQSELNQQYHVVFAPGYKTDDYSSGVYTASKVSPLSHCTLSHDEPWLGTPKATSISLYPLSEGGLNLLVVNLHGVNFSFGTRALTKQLDDASAAVQEHVGPVIFSGDFNTWSAQRTRVLESVMEEMQLNPLTFLADQRTRFLGYPLDHIYMRGLRVVNSGTTEVHSSDHNAVHATLAISTR